MSDFPKFYDVMGTGLLEDQFEKYRTGFIRYEKLRKLNPRQFMDLWARCLSQHLNFDQEVDRLEG